MRQIKASTLGLLVSLLALTGCESVQYREIHSSAKATERDAGALYTQAVAQPKKAKFIKENDGYYVPKVAMEVRDDGLPDVFSKPMDVKFEPKTNLRDVIEFMSRVTGVRFSLAPELSGGDSEKTLLFAGFSRTSTLRGLLDHVTSLPAPALSWHYKNGQVEIYRSITKSFALNMPSGTTTYKSESSNNNQAAGGKGGTASSGQTHTVNTTTNMWATIEKEVAQMLTPNFGKVVSSESTKMITVTDVPQAVNAVGAHIDNLNRTVLRKIFLNVQIVSVKSSSSDNYAMNLSTVFEKLARNYGMGVNFIGAGVQAGFPSNAGSLNVVLQANGQADPSSAVVSALSSLGKNASVSSYPIYARHGVPQHTAVNKDFGFLQSTTVTPGVVAGGAPTQALNPGTVTAGVSLHSTVYAIDGSTVSIEQDIEISSLDEIKSIGREATGQIQLPQVSRVSLSPKTDLKIGQTLMIAGLEQQNSQTNQQGMGNAINQWLVGATGSRIGNGDVTRLIVMITPYYL